MYDVFFMTHFSQRLSWYCLKTSQEFNSEDLIFYHIVNDMINLISSLNLIKFLCLYIPIRKFIDVFSNT